MKTLHIKYKNLLHIHPLTTVCTLQWVPVSKQLPALHKQHDYIVAAADMNFPRGADSVHTVRLLLEHRPTESHLVSFAVLISEYTSEEMGGQSTGDLWRSVVVVRVRCITGRHTGNCKFDTDITEVAALYHQKDKFYTLF